MGEARVEMVEMAKMAEQAERYEDMAKVGGTISSPIN